MGNTVDTAADAPYCMATPSKLKLPARRVRRTRHARFPFAHGRSYTPSDAPKEMLFRLHEPLGIQHCVIVQPACHGVDNTITADAA